MKVVSPFTVCLATTATYLIQRSDAGQRFRTARETVGYYSRRNSLFEIQENDDINSSRGSSSTNDNGRDGIPNGIEIELKNMFADEIEHWNRQLILDSLSMGSLQYPTKPPVTSPPVKPPSVGPTPYSTPGPTPYSTPGPTPYSTPGPTPYSTPGPTPYSTRRPSQYPSEGPTSYGTQGPTSYATGTTPVETPPSSGAPVLPPTIGPVAAPVYTTMAPTDETTSAPSSTPVVPHTAYPNEPPVEIPSVTLVPTISYAPSGSTPVAPPPSTSPVLPPTKKPVAASYAPSDKNMTVAPTPAPNVNPEDTLVPATTWEILMNRSEEFSVFLASSKAVGYDEVLQGDKELTLFAPNDDAFNNLMPTDLLDKYFDFSLWTEEYVLKLLGCHDIIGTVILSSQLLNGTLLLPCLDVTDPAYVVTTPPLQLSKATMPVPANIEDGDLIAENGVVHVIDQVMTNSFLRKNLPEMLEALGGFSILLELVVDSGLLETASGAGPFTLYAPPDSVFESYGQEFIDGLMADPKGTTKLLLNHVVSDLIVPCCLPDGSQFVSAAGFPLTIDDVDPENPSNYTVNGISTVPALVGILASNAKVNAIDDILFFADGEGPSEAPGTASPVIALPTSESPSLEPTTKSGTPSLEQGTVPKIPSLEPDQLSETPSLAPVLIAETVWDVILSRPEEFGTYIAAAEAVGYDDFLRARSAITVFVPEEIAFASLMPADLLVKYLDFNLWTQEYIQAVLGCHDIDDAVVLSTDLTNGTKFATCADLINPDFLFTSPPPQIEAATMPVPADIVEVDLLASNGVVHVVDQVLTTSFLRYNAVEAGEKLKQFTILLELVELTDLLDFFTGPGPFTIFAPSDDVFERYGKDFVDALKGDPDGTRVILLNHVVPDLIIPCCATNSTTYESAAGFPLVLDDIDEANAFLYTVNGISTVPAATNILVSNAKVNTITDILVLPVEEGSGIPNGLPSQMPSSV